MKAERAARLADLLGDLLDTATISRGELCCDIHKTFALPFVELVSPQYSNRRQEFYLARRAPADSHLPGRPWHILGGMWRLTQTQQDAYTATALRDLAMVVQSVRDVMTSKWP